YFTFMNDRGVDPTNNRTEQQIRFVVIGRKVIQGTKAEIGRQWCERIWATPATCRQRGKQLDRFLVESIEAKLGNRRCEPSRIY
ncbi:MAG: transposase, partial [Planctomycetota bacterium]